MSSSFLPVTDAERVLWLNNFSSRLGQYRVALGLTQAEVDSVTADATMYAYTVSMLDATRQYAKAMLSLKKQLRSASQQVMMPDMLVPPTAGNVPPLVNNGIFNRVVILANIIKHHGAYTETMGIDLGIIPPVRSFNPDAMTPVLTVRLEAGFPLLKWKKGESDSANIYVDRHDGNGFVFLRNTVRNRYTDTEPLAPNTYTATWDYKIRYKVGDDEAGNFSPIISVNVLRAG